MRIFSWNINGIRAAIRNGFLNFLVKEKPDILCLQEIKISEKDIVKQEFDFKGYKEFWNPAVKPGYSGTAILAREGVRAEKMLKLKWDNEGRIQILDLDKFYLANIYFPNANHELSRLDFKLQFNNALLKYLKKLEKKKPVVIGGDFNVAHKEIDLANPKNNIGNPGFTYEEREWMDKFLQAKFIDTFRHFHKDKIQYSWWSYRFNARARNIGWRIDYFCASTKMLKYTRPTAQTGVVKNSFILDKIKGSDHCPIGIEVKI
jgi:exodeoxyribonuclease-3